MNGPSMYRLKPVYEIPQNLDLPDCMYKLKNPAAITVQKSNETVGKDKKMLSSIMDKEPLPELTALEAKWDNLSEQLMQLKLQISEIRKNVEPVCRLTGYPLCDSNLLDSLKILHGAVINARPSSPPFSLLLLKHLHRSSVPIILNTHIHSSVSNFPTSLKWFDESKKEAATKTLNLHLIWKEDLLDTELVMNPVKQLPIKGEVNILRLFARSGLSLLKYPLDDILKTTNVDNILDLCHRLAHADTTKDRSFLIRMLTGKLGRNPYFGGEEMNIVDICCWSILKQIYDIVGQDLPPTLSKWYQKVDSIVF
ncbi:hypothetical protein RUM43_005812 [Polyplax serrata]|uniref:AIMP2 thioredoxin-like domain-containing protein n=1 Tax=Polyplax serrata TaxID=468196 RepID=A0AAN8P0I1_POLSC